MSPHADQAVLFDTPQPAQPKRRSGAHPRGLPPDVPWLDQYPAPGASEEQKRQDELQCRAEVDYYIRWWSAYHDELIRRTGGKPHYLQESAAPSNPECEEHACRYARAQRNPFKAPVLGFVPELNRREQRPI